MIRVIRFTLIFCRELVRSPPSRAINLIPVAVDAQAAIPNLECI
ncbi:MAG: hypothetical protein AAGD25_34745 [Cyanobacteria bacterium P01_F01_bin.150]